MSFSKFIKTPDFRKHGLRIVLVYVGLIVLSWMFLSWYTGHGQQVSVPDLRGMTVEQAREVLAERSLELLVIDSIFDEKAKGGTIVEQSPVPESQVKEGREVFLTIFRFQPPMETIGIEEGDFAQVALIKLRNKGVKYEVKYVPNNSMVGSVVSISYRGKKLRATDQVPRGETVVLSIGESDNEKVQIPNLVGMSYAQAIAQLDSLNLMPQPHFENNPLTAQDSSACRVCRQLPAFNPGDPGVSPGRFVDFWLSNTPCAADTTGIE
jgi:beta-lactam-binding protein with PASTA domain